MTITLHMAQHFHRVVGIVQYATAGRGQYRVFSRFQRTVRNIGHEEPDFRGFQPVSPKHRAYESIVPVKRIQQVGFSGLTLMARLGGG